jgi:hypothetical protein
MKDNHEHSHCYACGFQFKPDEWSTYITIKGEIDSALIHDDCLEILRHGMWKDKPLLELGHKIWSDDGREPESMQCGITNTNSTYPEPSTEAKLWVLGQIAKFIHDTEARGSFRRLIYEYLDLDYVEAYVAGGMDITNTLSHGNYKNFVGRVFRVNIIEDEPEIQIHSGD